MKFNRSRVALALIGFGLAALVGCGKKMEQKSYASGLEPTSEDVPIPIFEPGTEPECPYTVVGRVAVQRKGGDLGDKGTFDKRKLHADMQKQARAMGGHAVMVFSEDQRAGRVIPRSETIGDYDAGMTEDRPWYGTAREETEKRGDIDPETGEALDPYSETATVDTGMSIGDGGVGLGDKNPDRLELQGLVIYFTEKSCRW